MRDSETRERENAPIEDDDGRAGKRSGGRPTLPLEQRRTERISFGVTKTQKAAFLINAAEAGMSSNDYARAVLCAPGLRDAGARAGHGAARASAFELVDALARIGADLARLKFIAEQTGVVPDDLDARDRPAR